MAALGASLMRGSCPHMPGTVRIGLLTRPLLTGGTAQNIRHGGGKRNVSRQLYKCINKARSSPLLNGSRVVLQPAPDWVTGCGKAFPLQKDHGKKAAKLAATERRLDGAKKAEQLVA